MTMQENNRKEQSGQPQHPPARKIVRLIICLLLIGAGIIGARFLIASKPKVNRRPPEKMAPLVSTRVLEFENYTFSIPAMGTVIAAREAGLEAAVSGEIVYMHPEFTQGGMLGAGEKIVQIDPKDYELALQQKLKALADAEYAYRLELGHQDVARREWNLLYGDSGAGNGESDLALRKPHLEKVKAEIRAAGAEVEQARINLSRTILSAPFDALVLKTHVEQGSQVTARARLADLVASDVYHVQVSVPVERLKWISIPDGRGRTGSETAIYYRDGNRISGRVIRLLPDLSKEGRMARLLIEVEDPLGLQTEGEKPPMLLLGEYVRVAIQGEELQQVFRIPRLALRNDSEVWVVDGEGKLAIRPVKTVWRDEDSVVIRDGFRPEELLVISDIAAPVDGMNLRLEGAGKSEKQPEKRLQ